jgi:mannose-1-phosphate guanylyltransferase/mannose-1-phosphate guanylyltransferase/mannose-6-phosphate isomerase
MLQATLGRVQDLASPLIIANTEHLPDIARQVGKQARLVGEPIARNTAPAVAVAALLQEPDDVLLVLPADHHIADAAAFRRAVDVAVEAAEGGHLVAFGIVPTKPETGYGYIIGGEEALGGRVIERFVEKPDRATAANLIDRGARWNGGIFAFQAGVLLEEMEAMVPDVIEASREALEQARKTDDVLELGDAFARAPALSIDVAVMERTSRGLMVSLDAGWSDAGSWASLYELGVHDQAGNVVAGDVVAEDVTGSYLRGEGPLVAVLGVENLVVVATPDAVLVASRERVGEVKALVERFSDRRPDVR